jgi:hypothetical protein
MDMTYPGPGARLQRDFACGYVPDGLWASSGKQCGRKDGAYIGSCDSEERCKKNSKQIH